MLTFGRMICENDGPWLKLTNMTVFLILFILYLLAVRRGYWPLTPRDRLARNVERGLAMGAISPMKEEA